MVHHTMVFMTLETDFNHCIKGHLLCLKTITTKNSSHSNHLALDKNQLEIKILIFNPTCLDESQ